MAKQRSRVADYLVYVVVRFLVCVLQGISYDAARAWAAGLAWLAFRIDRRHRDVARDNLRHAFPGGYSDEQLTAMVRRVYLHFCILLVELVHLRRRLHPNNWRRHLDLSQARPMVDWLLSGRPLLLVTGHFGNWEMGGYALGLLGFRTCAVARPLDNPFLDDFLRRFRESTGQRLLAKHGDFEQMQALLERGGILATLGDQDAGQRGLFVDFFGRPASTHKAMALLCLEHHVPILVIGTPRIAEPFYYRVELEDVILPEDYAQRGDAVRAITQRLTTALEHIVRRYPEQYFWLHNRWKHQPKESKARRQVA